MSADEPDGVDYGVLDPFKRAAQQIAATTDHNIERFGLEVVRESRGESVFLIRSKTGAAPTLLGTVPETLGTKNLVADAVRPISGKTYYDSIAQDTVAMNVNDLITLGALPVVVGAHIAAGSSSWFDDADRTGDLLRGWKAACDLAGCVYGPGESPALVDLVSRDSAVLSGFGLGIIRDEEHRITSTRIRDRDAIVLFESSGIHANGLTDARRLADRLEAGYATPLPNGQHFGDALLAPTLIYTRIIESLQDAGVTVHYATNITGHGWRKLMRAREPFRYIVEVLPEVSPLFQFLVGELELTSEDAYGKLNMGAGFAIFVGNEDTSRVVEAASAHGIRAWHGGYVEAADARTVEIPSLGVLFPESSLSVR
jgi:phosphoribosylformylglycinamidine cyclo-ligase